MFRLGCYWKHLHVYLCSGLATYLPTPKARHIEGKDLQFRSLPPSLISSLIAVPTLFRCGYIMSEASCMTFALTCHWNTIQCVIGSWRGYWGRVFHTWPLDTHLSVHHIEELDLFCELHSLLSVCLTCWSLQSWCSIDSIMCGLHPTSPQLLATNQSLPSATGY